jgi:hypothetical protein
LVASPVAEVRRAACPQKKQLFLITKIVTVQIIIIIIIVILVSLLEKSQQFIIDIAKQHLLYMRSSKASIASQSTNSSVPIFIFIFFTCPRPKPALRPSPRTTACLLSRSAPPRPTV